MLNNLYSGLINDGQNKLKAFIKKGFLISVARGLIFIAALGLIIIFWNRGFFIPLLIFVLSGIPFFYLLNQSNRIQFNVRYNKELIQINQNEINCLAGDYSAFASGSEYINTNHPYTFDLDIFGNGSIYQVINRACTKGGSNLLANQLIVQDSGIVSIRERQKAIKELSEMLTWRQNFLANGNILLESSKINDSGDKYHHESKFHDETMDWLGSNYYFKTSKFLDFLLLLSPLISVTLLVLVIPGIINPWYFILFGLFQLSIIAWNLKKINHIHSHVGRKSQILKKYGILLSLIEKVSFKSPYLQKLKDVNGISNHMASKSILHIQSLASALDNRLNILFAIFANALFLHDLQVSYRIEKWRYTNRDFLPMWFDTIYHFDALSGYANFSFNNPGFCFPEISQDNFQFEFQQVGHPLIPGSLRVSNDFQISGNDQLYIITGANMAGKSTFLRTIGLNLVLASAGSAVCANSFKFSPINLHTSMRTNDSVQNSESYFYAELKRLKTLIDRIQSGEKLFVIIDEMLRGTNSKDKHSGSEALIAQLIRLNARGLIATHDISLGTLANKFQDKIKNYRFEVEIKDDELLFDYKIKEGVSQNLNATFLMKKMGITI